MSDYTDIEVEIDDPTAVIRLNRPDKLNAFTYHTLDEIRRAVDAAAADARVVGIVITGAGRGFSAGLDAAVLAEVTSRSGTPENTPADSAEPPGLFNYLTRVPKPVIAAVNGVAAGGGLILALMCDLRFAAATAQFTTVFLKRDKIGADEARQIGLVDQVMEPDQLLQGARDYVERLAVTSSPAAIAESKALVYRHLGMGLDAALRDAELSQNRFVNAPDAAEGARALLEKRAPSFARLGSD